MIDKNNFEDLAKDIKLRDKSQNIHGFEIQPDTGMKITWYGQGYAHWHQEEYNTSDPRQAFNGNEKALLQYNIGYDLWVAGERPDEWIEALRPIYEAKLRAGNDGPLEILSLVLLILQNGDSAMEQILVKNNFGRLLEEEFDLDFEVLACNKDEMIRFIDLFLGANRNKYLYERFASSAVYDMPIESVFDYFHYVYIVDGLIDEVKDPKILDIGTGKGDLSKFNQRVDATVYSVDRYQLPGVFDINADYANYAWADARRLPIKSESMDLVTSLGVLGHNDVEAISQILAESARVLKVGGKILINLQGPPLGSEKIERRMSMNSYYDQFAAAQAGCRVFTKNSDGQLVEDL